MLENWMDTFGLEAALLFESEQTRLYLDSLSLTSGPHVLSVTTVRPLVILPADVLTTILQDTLEVEFS